VCVCVCVCVCARVHVCVHACMHACAHERVWCVVFKIFIATIFLSYHSNYIQDCLDITDALRVNTVIFYMCSVTLEEPMPELTLTCILILLL